MKIFWAKTNKLHQPAISVRDHCLNVGCVAEKLVDLLPILLRKQLPIGLATLAALHDIGKITPGFQLKCIAWVEQEQISPQDQLLWRYSESNHALMSQYFLQSKVAVAWASAVGAHHGRLLARGKIRRSNEQQESTFNTYREVVSEQIESILGVLPRLSSPDENIRWFVAGLITVADWLGSNEEFFPLEWPEKPYANIDQRYKNAQDSLDLIGWQPREMIKGLTFETIFSNEAKQQIFKPNPLQQAVISTIDKPGFYLIEGSMGNGKTEAALMAAYQLIEKGHHHGLFFGLPTQVTSNRIYERVERFLKRCHSDQSKANLLLTHANSWIKKARVNLNPSYYEKKESYSEASDHVENGHFWFNPVKRSLLAQYGVGTIDQALLGIVRAKHFFVRQFGLAGKVIILDEVHSYDLYTGTLIDKLIERLLSLKCTVIILSATLTEQRRQELLHLSGAKENTLSNAYPLLSGVQVNGESISLEIDSKQTQTVVIQCTSLSVEELTEECLERAEKGGCVLWIRNTVHDAQESWKLLKNFNREGGPEIGLLHSRFPFWRREQLEDKWINCLGKNASNRPKGCVLVSTQVVEQSVDIDADFLITDLAPSDMLFQRLGRLWRHECKERPFTKAEAWISAKNLAECDTEKSIKTALGRSRFVYSPYVLLRSWNVWSKYTQVKLPQDIRPVLEETYKKSEGLEPMAWQLFLEKIQEFRAKQQQKAQALTLVESDLVLEDEEGVMTRWNSMQTVSLLLLHRIEDKKSSLVHLTTLDGQEVLINPYVRDFNSARLIHENIVKIPFNTIENYAEPPFWLKKYVQGPCVVAQVINGQIKLISSRSSKNLNWHTDEGVSIETQQKNRVYDENEPCD